MLKVVTVQNAIETIRSACGRCTSAAETVRIADALTRILAADIIAQEDVPPFDRSTVDGYAVHSADTFGAGDAIPAELACVAHIQMGQPADCSVGTGTCAGISTGGMLPAGADAVVMVEQTEEAFGQCLVYAGVAPGENVNQKGSDIKKGTVAVRAGTRITPAVTGILAALGIYEIPVCKKPVAAIISTGDEIVNTTPVSGQIRDINTYLLDACAKQAGCDTLLYGAVKDDRNRIAAAVADCLQKADVVLISGGSSAGAMDMTCSILDEIGEVYFHGIAVKPGKPTIFAMADAKPVFGLPGHPLAAYFVFRLFVTEYLHTIMRKDADRPFRTARLNKNIPSNHGREELICVRIDDDGHALPLYTKSGVISVLSEADGFIRIPRESEGLPAGTEVKVYRL
ncbi:MAG: molybdopterin molybdotransferase MoeA [Clostridia bacterium]|nr:molybdopterin molybdotransferase MoeA [Clostridia bacterium]